MNDRRRCAYLDLTAQANAFERSRGHNQRAGFSESDHLAQYVAPVASAYFTMIANRQRSLDPVDFHQHAKYRRNPAIQTMIGETIYFVLDTFKIHDHN